MQLYIFSEGNDIADAIIRLIQDVDGVLQCTSSLYELGGVNGWQKWLSPKPVFNIGALSPPATGVSLALTVVFVFVAILAPFVDLIA